MRRLTFLFALVVVTVFRALAAEPEPTNVTVQITIPSGFSMIGNPLDSANDHVAALFATLPEGSSIYRFNGRGYDVATRVDGAWEGDLFDVPVASGVFVFNPGPAFAHIFQGTVPSFINQLAAGFHLLCAPYPGLDIPKEFKCGTQLPWPRDCVLNVYQWTGPGYRVNSVVDGTWEGDDGGNPPIPTVGEGFFVYLPEPFVWTHNYGQGN